MKIDVIAILPEIIEEALKVGVPGRAQESNLIKLEVHNLRDFAADKHRTVDDYPYGGGSGMLLKPAPIFNAVNAIKKRGPTSQRIILLTPQGQTLTQKLAERLSLESHLILICGRYKGVDERVREALVTDEISIGDYVLSCGELPALILINAVVRLIPGAIGDYESAQEDSFSSELLDSPYYTRPAEYEGMKVPEVLLGGHHEKIKQWRREQSLKRTFERRRDLLEKAHLSDEDRAFIEALKNNDAQLDW